MRARQHGARALAAPVALGLVGVRRAAARERAGSQVFRGPGGVSAEKSALLLSVSVQPAALRAADDVFVRVGAAPAPSKKLALP